MPFSSGTYSLPAGNPVTTGTTISSTWANNTFSDIASALSSAVLKDGTQTITADLPMSSHKLTGLSAGSAAGHSLRYEQVFTTGTLTLLGALVAGGQVNTIKAANLAAAATVAIGAVTGNYAVVSGTATVSSFDTLAAGGVRIIEWSGATPLDNNANLILPGNASLTTAAGDMSIAISEGSAQWRLWHQKFTGAPILMSPITNSLGADVSCSATGTFATGPSVAQSTAGTWFASGSVTFKDTAGAASFRVKLWDGTNVIASTEIATTGASNAGQAKLSGFITNPAGNIRISVQDISSTSGAILFNQSGASKDSTVTAIRIA